MTTSLYRYFHRIARAILVAIIAVTSALPLAATAQGGTLDVAWRSHGTRIFAQKTFAPGDRVQHVFAIENRGGVQDLYMRVRNVRGETLARELSFDVFDRETGRYYIGERGRRTDVATIEQKGRIFLSRIDAGARKYYVVRIKFKDDAPNSVQGKRTRFDITVGFIGEPVTAQTPLPQRFGRGFVYGDGESSGVVLGAETISDAPVDELILASDGTVTQVGAGQSLKWWIWLAVLLAFIVMAIMTTRFVRGHSARGVIAHILLFAIGVGNLFMWYILDRQHENVWFPVGIGCVMFMSILWQYFGQRRDLR